MRLFKGVHVCASVSVYSCVYTQVGLWIYVCLSIWVCWYRKEKELAGQGDDSQCWASWVGIESIGFEALSMEPSSSSPSAHGLTEVKIAAFN